MRLVLVLLFLGCGRHQPPALVHASYPGFSLDVPAGMPPPGERGLASDAGATYAQGMARLISSTSVYAVTWVTETLPADGTNYVQEVDRSIAPEHVLGTERRPINGHDAIRFDIGRGDDFWAMVAIACGRRVVTVSVHAQDEGVVTIQRMLEHFDCHPDDAEERRLAK